MTGRASGVALSRNESKIVCFPYISTVVTQRMAVVPAGNQWYLTHLYGTPRVAGNDGSAVTFSFYKAASGIAVGSGTILHSGTYDLKGTADTNQLLTLVGNPDTLTFVGGDSIGFVLTGTATVAVGAVFAIFEPFNN